MLNSSQNKQHHCRMLVSIIRLCWILPLLLIEGLVVPPSRLVGRNGMSSIRQHHHYQRQLPSSSLLFMSKMTSDDDITTTTTTTSPGGNKDNNNNNNNIFSESIQLEAKNALEGVGWASPTSLIEDGELTSNDPFVQQIDASIREDYGVGLDDLLNPAKVVNLERELYNLRLELSSLTGVDTTTTTATATTFGREEDNNNNSNYDGGGGGPDADAIRAKITKKSNDLAIERRSVFRGWLKNIFIGQAVISFGISYVMATNPSVLFGGYDWYYSYNM
jgi:hypothetical protein